MGRPAEASYVLIPGAGGMAWYLHRVARLLAQLHREAVAVDLPGDNASEDLDVYIVVRESDRGPTLSSLRNPLGAFTAGILCERVPINRLALVNAMIPLPAETAGVSARSVPLRPILEANSAARPRASRG